MTLIKKPHELEPRQRLKVLIYGQPKIGKTTLALSAPKPLLLDFDGGVNRVKPEHRVDTVQISSWDDVIAVLKEDLSPYETIVIDTVGQMMEFMAAYLISNDSRLARGTGDLTLAGYGARNMMFKHFINSVSTLNKHVIFVAHEVEDKSGKGDLTIKRPDISGKSGGSLMRLLCLIGYMQAHGSKRTISFNPSEDYYAGNTCDLDPVIQVPDCSSNANKLFTSIFQRNDEKNADRALSLEYYHTLLEEIEALIALIENAESANKFVQAINGFKHVYDSKIRAGLWMKEKAKALGLVFNKEAKCYEEASDGKD
jgi:phage nucleotide-binding protein